MCFPFAKGSETFLAFLLLASPLGSPLLPRPAHSPSTPEFSKVDYNDRELTRGWPRGRLAHTTRQILACSPLPRRPTRPYRLLPRRLVMRARAPAAGLVLRPL